MITDLIIAATEYARRGWSVIPTKADKTPAVSAWKSRQSVAATPDEVPGWFGRARNVVGVGIIMGKVSGHLFARDFDDPAAYTRWTAAFPVPARKLPTVKTRRGFHVYARWEGVRTATMPDGELRGEGSYVVAPPSLCGPQAAYEWAVPLPDGPLPEVDPGAVGLDRCWAESPAAPQREQSEQRELRDGGNGDTEATEDTEDDEAITRRWNIETREQIEAAIARTLPPTNGKRNASIFRLARALKAIPQLAGIRPERVRILKPIVLKWHALALARITTIDVAVTWGDFAHAWAKVRHAEGADVLGDALRVAKGVPTPAWAADYSEPCRTLAGLCRELQRRSAPNPFFLSAAKAGESVGVDKGTAWRWLLAFVADRALRIEVKGSAKTGRATRFRYVADDADPAPMHTTATETTP